VLLPSSLLLDPVVARGGADAARADASARVLPASSAAAVVALPPSPAAVLFAARGAAAAAGSRAARASDAALVAGRAGVVARGAAQKRKRPAATIGDLEAVLHTGVSDWVGSKRPRAANPRASFIPPVPQQLLDDASTTKPMLPDLCRERTIAFGDTDSVQSLKTGLRRFNAS